MCFQAAHHSLTEIGTRLSHVPSELSAVPGGGVAGAARGTPSRLPDADGKPGASPGMFDGGGHKYSHQGVTAANGVGQYHHGPYPMSISNLVVPCPCLRPFGRHASRPDAATVLYAMSTAVREALPLWLLAGAKDGGMEATPQRVGTVFAAGVLIAGAGRMIAAAAGCCGDTSLSDGGNGETGRRLSRAVWTRLVSVAVLALLHLLPRLLLSPSAAAAVIPSVVLWLAVTAVVAANQASLDVCSIGAAAAGAANRSRQQEQQKSPMCVSRNTSSSSHGGGGGGGDERTRATSDASSRGGSGLVVGINRGPTVMRASILFVGGVVGPTAGPLVLALTLWLRLRSPLDTSFWLLLCMFGDLWLAAGSREAKPLHVRLLGGEDGEDEEEEEEERKRAQRFAQFV